MRNVIKSRAMLVIFVLFASILCSGVNARTRTITSGEFSLGYGATSNTGVAWTTGETASKNTPTTIGDFKFIPTVTGWAFTATGPIFTDRALAFGSATSVCGNPANFGVSIAGSWVGEKPADAADVPNYRVKLNITSLRMMATAYTAVGAQPGISFAETTADHTSSSSILNPPLTATSGDWRNPYYYSQLVWNPDDFIVDGPSCARI